ncbi:hypothetical protein PG999_011376 [Apiospora kogelbergensis]|uniref:Uncharacterized protein n=2 Tax=Apiospora kogelbergensis TaxID=1337665 RepID=A0AAW0QEP3_9PEZI
MAWSDEDIQRLLFFLNISVGRIRESWPFEDNSFENSSRRDRAVGISRACDCLAELLPAFSATQIKKKMRALWQNYGPNDGNREPDNLFLQGAWTNTLPHLGMELPGIWNRVNQDVDLYRE